ncbi:EcoAI/FtnUII family type I restriction enzme subunit R [Dinghuibacter silviterrae]|uniref:Type I restriction enzyme R subunit n=1 Tax=Dinghuibacter silviterrae TaxID=1539049 RepID=A0A4R8DHY7_9BACT|nr:DEAD/DEAH box helicase family protein [Dinghuibacter silviterrae]TDW97157.1 type I restriction enzyme R subunit [Dinghuibacter silviterrae]
MGNTLISMGAKHQLSERDICTKYITPALQRAGWDIESQILEEVSFTDGKIFVRGKLTARGKRKRADYILYYNSNPIAIIEAKDNNHSVNAGIQQALEYARILDIPCVFSSNGDAFLFHDRTAKGMNIELELGLDQFPSPEELWNKFKIFKGIKTEEQERIISQEYYSDSSGRKPRYYQEIAINRTIEATVKGQNRILLVMATGTGKTYTAFQIVYRLWKARVKKRILFLADRNALIDQTKKNDFRHFGDKMTWVKKRQVDKSYEIFLALYQGLSGNEEEANIYKQFSPDFFDLVIIDECHRGSAKEDSAWREILEYFTNATHLGLTATPKETNEISNIEYFGDPIYTYSLKQGIDDGFLAPYRVVRVGLNIDLEGWRPPKGKLDKDGNLVEDRIYNRRDFDRNIVIEERTDTVARKVTEFLYGAGRFSKTIIFCVDIDHAERMRSALSRHNADLVRENYKYIMQITGDNDEGKKELDNFINPEEKYPVIATTSKLMSTGVDAQTCKVIVLDSNIQSMTEFKQIIGRGTRIREDFGKLYFTILDFRNVTDLFADPEFDGPPIRIKEASEEENLSTIEDEEEEFTNPIIDNVSGEEISVRKPPVRYPDNDTISYVREGSDKTYVSGVAVSVLVTREMYFDNEGRPITVSLKDHTREIITNHYSSMTDFLNRWNQSDKKAAIIKELEEQGVLVSALQDAVNRELDLFDLVCHVAFDQPPLTRKERVNNVKKRNYFTKYGEQSKKVLEALLDKYADEGIATIESAEVLSIDPLVNFGTPREIIDMFGGKENYTAALKDLESQLYA